MRKLFLLLTLTLALPASAQVLPDPTIPFANRPISGAGLISYLQSLLTAVQSQLTGKPGHTANAATLAALTPVAGLIVIRDDVNALYSDTGVSCTQADGGWQVQPSAGHCWQTDISRGAPIQLWGGKPDNGATDNAPAIRLANAALANVAGASILFPASTGCYGVGSTVTVSVSIQGQGNRASQICSTFATGDVISEGTGTAPSAPISPTIRDIGFTSTVTRTGGAMLHLWNTYGAIVRNVQCLTATYVCIDVDSPAGATSDQEGPGGNSSDNWIENVIQFGGYDAIRVGFYGRTQNLHILNIHANNETHAGIDLIWVNGTWLEGNETLGARNGLLVRPASSTQSVGAIYGNKNFFDTSTAEGMLFDGTAGGLISDFNFSNTWVATSGAGQASGSGGTSASAGIYFNALGSNIRGNVFKDTRVFNGLGDGVKVSGVIDLQMSGEIMQNGRAATSAASSPYVGFRVGAASAHVKWDGRIGGVGQFGAGVANNQFCAWYTDATANDYLQIIGDLSGNVNGYCNNSPGSNIDVMVQQ